MISPQLLSESLVVISMCLSPYLGLYNLLTADLRANYSDVISIETFQLYEFYSTHPNASALGSSLCEYGMNFIDEYFGNDIVIDTMWQISHQRYKEYVSLYKNINVTIYNEKIINDNINIAIKNQKIIYDNQKIINENINKTIMNEKNMINTQLIIEDDLNIINSNLKLTADTLIDGIIEMLILQNKTHDDLKDHVSAYGILNLAYMISSTSLFELLSIIMSIIIIGFITWSCCIYYKNQHMTYQNVKYEKKMDNV